MSVEIHVSRHITDFRSNPITPYSVIMCLSQRIGTSFRWQAHHPRTPRLRCYREVKFGIPSHARDYHNGPWCVVCLCPEREKSYSHVLLPMAAQNGARVQRNSGLISIPVPFCSRRPDNICRWVTPSRAVCNCLTSHMANERAKCHCLSLVANALTMHDCVRYCESPQNQIIYPIDGMKEH